MSHKWKNNQLSDWTQILKKTVQEELNLTGHTDVSHYFGHFCRISTLAARFAKEQNGEKLITFAAGMLHDIVTLPKNDPDAKNSSLYAANRAKEILLELQFPKELISNVCHSVHAHSLSAKIEPKTIEAKCLQDADRMESLGAFGLMRVFYCSGLFGSELLDKEDPAAENREINDKKFALDHFVQKLFKLYDTMQTEAGRKTALSLSNFLKEYRDGLINDHKSGNLSSAHYKIARTYQNAGQKKLPLFHPEDPFAQKGRPIEQEHFALDSLLRNNDPYIIKFLDQLRFELNGYQVLSNQLG